VKRQIQTFFEVLTVKLCLPFLEPWQGRGHWPPRSDVSFIRAGGSAHSGQ
jgi:hypothetical protein